MNPIQVLGKDYYLSVGVVSGSTASGDVNVVVELYGEEPTFENDEALIEPVRTFHCFGDAGQLYHQLKPALDVLNATRSL
jgi:hypothetical protein